jgi:hypothetical protein
VSGIGSSNEHVSVSVSVYDHVHVHDHVDVHVHDHVDVHVVVYAVSLGEGGAWPARYWRGTHCL